MVFLKQHAPQWGRVLAAPMRSIGLFFIRTLGVPGYRLVFFLRRWIQKVLLPAKSRVVYVISNRYTVHALMILIVSGVTWVNLSVRDVRAEDFGQQSILYQLVAQDDSAVLEVVEAGATPLALGTRTSYVEGMVIDARRHVDFDFLEETATPLVGEEAPEAVEPVQTRTQTETYVVQEGDTLGAIAERYGLSISTVLWSNSLSYTSTIRPGQELTILPVDGVVYTVRSGDTLSRIARQYAVDVETIMEQNGLASANRLAIGDKLLLPGAAPPSRVSTTRSSASISTLFTPPSVSAPSAAVDGWIWPTNWRVITQYYGWRHTGVDIDGDYTTSSFAARGGVVIYSGWRSGYGLTVEVDHGDGYVTRYAHHSKNYVAVGEVVSAGQVLAQTGTTGRSTGTHLHFEVIRNGRFQNPLDYVR